jgi:hypothetical protein
MLQKVRQQPAGDTSAFYGFGEMKTSSVAIGNQKAFVVQKELGYPRPRFSLHAIYTATGKPSWSFTELRSSIAESYCSSPIVANGKVFFGWGEGKAYAMDVATGNNLWSASLKGDIIASPAIADGTLYFVTTEGLLYAYDLNATPNPMTFSDGTYCFPNPAKVTSSIQCFMMKSGSVEVRIFDASERLVKKFSRTGIPAGAKEVFGWDVHNVPNGTYPAMVSVKYEDGSTDRKAIKIAVLR